MTNDDLLIDVLRAAGHEDAAVLASKLTEACADPKPAADESSETPAASTALSPAEAQRQAEGRAMLAEMKRALPDRFAA